MTLRSRSSPCREFACCQHQVLHVPSQRSTEGTIAAAGAERPRLPTAAPARFASFRAESPNAGPVLCQHRPLAPPGRSSRQGSQLPISADLPTDPRCGPVQLLGCCLTYVVNKTAILLRSTTVKRHPDYCRQRGRIPSARLTLSLDASYSTSASHA